ncbi:MAG: RNA polymerase-associated protein RapA [Syntrophomonadaceae bacterium]|nr:RNA polymerase-associated protein RapA [Bacillota bacterium]
MEKLVLRDYQEVGVQFLVDRQRAVLGDEPGLGKTVMALEALKRLPLGSGPFLILGPKISLGVWKRELLKWYDETCFIYSGDLSSPKRENVWMNFKQKGTFLVANYRMLDELLARQVSWQGIVCDEIHLAGILNRTTDTYKSLTGARTRALFLLSGTPVRRGPQDLFGPFSLINPYKFDSYYKFVGEYCVKIKDTFGYSIEPRPKNPEEFKKVVAQYLLRRRKSKVLKDLPPKQRQAVPLVMTQVQEALYRKLEADMYVEISNSKVIAAPNTVVSVLRQRQLLVTPQILGNPEPGAALEALVEMAEVEFDSGRSIAICTPFVSAIPFIQKQMEKLTKALYIIHGKIEEPADNIAQRFQRDGAKRKAIIYSIKSGTSFDAYGASTVFFVGCEWSSLDNLQAEDRIHRLGQTEPVMIYYLLYENTVDDRIIELLDNKTVAANWTLHIEDVLKRRKGGERDGGDDF